MKKRTNHRGHFFLLLAVSVVLIQSLPSQGDPKYKPTLQDYHSSRVIAHRSKNGAASAPEADEHSAHVEALGDFAGEQAAFGQGATFGNSDSAGTVSTGTTGACCLSTPTCSCVANQTVGQCSAAGGIFQGNKSVCANDICGCLVRACCDPAGSCIGDQTRAACEGAGHTWHIEASCGPGAPQLPMPMCNVYNVNNCSWDNGAPLNDGGANRSHVHSGGVGQLPRYDFSTADDFILRGPDSTLCMVSSVRWWFSARPADTTGPVFTPADPPNDFVGMNVTVFASLASPVTGLDSPAGHGNVPAHAEDLNPKVPDAPLGVVYARTFFNNEGPITYTDLTGTFCDPPPSVGTEAGYVWQADIVIDPPILLNKNTRYWLTVQGLFPFNDGLRETHQTWWMHSQRNTGIRARTHRTGNAAYVVAGQQVWAPMGQSALGAIGGPEAGNAGAAAPCAAVPANTRFDVPFLLNGGKVPASVPNNDCDDIVAAAQNAFDGYNPFDNTGAGTDGPGSCAINQDIWFRYTATCDGMLTAELCDSTFDSAVAIYSNVGCPMGGEELDCDSTSCGDDGRALAIVAETADLLIRVGGDGAAEGSGVLHIECRPACGIDDGSPAVNNCCTDHSAAAIPGNIGCESANCCAIVCSTPGLEGCCTNLVSGWNSACAAAAVNTPACQCPCTFNCLPGEQIEAEPCGSSTNEGCNVIPEAFESLGAMILGLPKLLCGSVWATGVRDTDWFRFDIPGTPSGFATLSLVLDGNVPVGAMIFGRAEPADVGAGETFCTNRVCSGAVACQTAVACITGNDCPPTQNCISDGANLILFDAIATAGCNPTDGLGGACGPLNTCLPAPGSYVVVVTPAYADVACGMGDEIGTGVSCGVQYGYRFQLTAHDDCTDGACCTFDGGCEDGSPGTARNEYECFLANGTFAGEGTTCEALPPDVDCADVAHGCAAATIISCGETLMIDLTTDDHLPEEPYPCGDAGHDPKDRAWLRFRAPCVDDNDLPGVVCPGPGVVCPSGGVCPGPAGTPCFPGEFCDFCPADGLSCVVGTVCSGDDCDDQTGPDKTSVRLDTCDSINPGRDSLVGIYGSCCPISGVCPSGAACDEGTFCGGACGVETPFANSGCSDDDCGFTELLSDICDQNLIEGETYYIQMSNWAEPVNGIYALSLSCPCSGACCNGASATCTDDVPVHECPAPMEFHTDEVCANVSPICGLGACCHANGTCTDALAPDCTALGDNHFLGTFCSRIVCNVENSCDFNTGDPTAPLDQANFGFRSQFAQDIDFFVEIADQFNLMGSPSTSCAIGSITYATFHTSHDSINDCQPGGSGAACDDKASDYAGIIVTISLDEPGPDTGPTCPPTCTPTSCTPGPDGDFHDDEGIVGCQSFSFGPALDDNDPIPVGNYWTYEIEFGGQPEFYITLHFQPPVVLEKNQEYWLAITNVMRDIAGYNVVWFASNNFNGEPAQAYSTGGFFQFEPLTSANDMLFEMQGVKVSDSDCGECRLHGDVAELPSVACLIDVDDLLCVLDGFADIADCPQADIVPCAPDPCSNSADCAVSQTGTVCIGGACRCEDEADCAALGALCAENRQGGRCELVDVDDILSELDAFAGTFDCPAPCAPGACVGDFIDDGLGNPTCRDGDALGPFFVGNGMSETDCFTLTSGKGIYCGDMTVCDPDATCPGSP